MELDHLFRVFKLYCHLYEKDPADADSMLLTDEERKAVSELKELVKENSALFARSPEKGVAVGSDFRRE